MEILGIGPLELVLILVIALLVFGPDKLPEIGAKLGRGMRELRRMLGEVTQNVNDVIGEPMAELRQPLDGAKEIVQNVAEAADMIRDPARTLRRAIVPQSAGATTRPEQAGRQSVAEPGTAPAASATISAEPPAPVEVAEEAVPPPKAAEAPASSAMEPGA